MLHTVSLFGEELSAVVGLVTSVVSAAFTILVTIACIDESIKRGITSLPLFGLFAGLFYLGMVLGDFVGICLSDFMGLSPLLRLGVFTICVYAVSVGYFIFERVWNKKKAAKETAGDDAATIEEDKYSALANRYSLSRREKDVWLLLVQGRDTPYIAEKLFITKNTVSSHVKNIYRKMNVHSRQELIDLFHAESSEDSNTFPDD